ncbi:hypothetical protein DVR12_02405 [Chitinophaga silvatica]|uniref:Uncharacterized protein n=1 Tax=Chitinophaga silvatica TaxID=2282649 RepID=A0A3E1YGY9_9BACT|nr:hypothetical protein [Chitinophaga silvatica]RFS26661.1 hypothetical protein DVR12_02405 [Chitinophaga silvatica]
MQKKYLLILLGVILLGACRKGTPAEEHYFGRIKVTLLNLPDAGKAGIFMDSEKLGEIDPRELDNLELLLPAGKSGKLKIIDAASNNLIADSNVVVVPNTKQEFRVGYSESLNLKGFISDINVPEDSIRVQIIYSLKKPFNNYPDVELHLYSVYMEETGIILKGLKLNDPNPHILTFPKLGEGDNPLGYFFKLKNVKTGEFIMDASGSDVFPLIFASSDYYGHYLFININDDSGETADENYFSTTITIL